MVKEEKIWTSNESLERLIKDYQSKRCLWDLNDEEYKNYEVKAQSWAEIADEHGASIPDVQKKITILRCRFRQECHKILDSQTSSSSQELYKPKWFGYNLMTFLLDVKPSSKKKKRLKLEEGINSAFKDSIIAYEATPEGSDERHIYISGDGIPVQQDFTPIHDAVPRTEREAPQVQPVNRVQASCNVAQVAYPQPLLPRGVGDCIKQDDDDVFGLFIASQIRTFKNQKLKRCVKLKIHQLIFEEREKELEEMNE